MDAEKWFPNTPSMRGDATPDPVVVSDQTDRPLSVAERFYGRDATPEEVSAAVQASPGGPPAEYQFVIPQEFEHLGLTHDVEAQKSYSAEFRKMGLSQESVNSLINLHIRHNYGGK